MHGLLDVSALEKALNDVFFVNQTGWLTHYIVHSLIQALAQCQYDCSLRQNIFLSVMPSGWA
jgi:hypothetical protein